MGGDGAGSQAATKPRVALSLALVVAASTAFSAAGCSTDDFDNLGQCCTEFKVGADLTNADFGVDPSIAKQFGTMAQAASDFGVTAQTMLDEVTLACRAIAQDLAASSFAQKAAESSGDQEKANKWCALAATALQDVGISRGMLVFETPRFSCETSVRTKTDCQGRCAGEPKCDITAVPLSCEGGVLVSECQGTCTAEDNASFWCKGKCAVAVAGSCTARTGVECEGRCDGICKGEAQGESGTGLAPDGTCDGICEGTCAATKVGATCDGTFEGECRGSCAMSGTTRPQCNTACDSLATPLLCDGGYLKGGCAVDPKCDANCDAIVAAKANCSVEPFSIRSVHTGVDAAVASLRVNLPTLVRVVAARGQSIQRVANNFTEADPLTLVPDPTKIGIRGTACVGVIGPVVVDAVENAKTAATAGAKVLTQVGLN